MRALFLLLLVLSMRAEGQVWLPRFFSDNMVLQRGRPVHFWGRGIPGGRVRIRFSHAVKAVNVGRDSTWSIFFGSRDADTIPQYVTIESGGRKIVLKNILIGDVWICSGQSNMEFPFEKEAHAAMEYAHAGEPLIRLCNPAPAGRYVYGGPYTDSLTRRLNTDSFYLWTDWQVCDSSAVRPMSAVGYYFARKIVENVRVPIGIINLSIGGAPIETFISRSALASSPQFASKVKPGNWLDNEALPAWTRERGRQNIAGATVNGDDLGPNHAYKPGFAFDGGVGPLLPMAVKGILWYQGESNSLEPERVTEYPALMRLLIDDYRAKWRSPDLAFYWVQLSSIDTVHYQSHYWPEFRDGQRRLLSAVDHGGMAVCSDIGFRNNVHPTDKKDVGERLALWALSQDYHAAVIPSGPLPVSAHYREGTVVVDFQYGDGLRTSDGGILSGVSLDGGKQDVFGTIDGTTIRIPAAEKPAFVYYGWRPFSNGNLVNAKGLPASTFKINVQ